MTHSPGEIATAYHEAGHAVIALTLGRPVSRVSVQPGQQRLGHCEIQKGTFRQSKDALETEILILLGGPAAEARHTGRYDWNGASQDLRGVRRLSEQRAASQRQVERLERRCLDKAEHLLNQPAIWSAVELIANELLRCTTISGRSARHFFDQTVTRAEIDR